MEDEDVKMQLAVLHVEMKANHLQQTTQIDGIRLLLEKDVSNLKQEVEHNRANSDMKFEKVTKDHDELSDRVTQLELASSTQKGWIAGIAAVCATIAAIAGFFFDHILALFKS